MATNGDALDEYGRQRLREFLRWHVGFWVRYAPQRADGSWPTMQGREPAFVPRSPLEALFARTDEAAIDYITDELLHGGTFDTPPSEGRAAAEELAETEGWRAICYGFDWLLAIGYCIDDRRLVEGIELLVIPIGPCQPRITRFAGQRIGDIVCVRARLIIAASCARVRPNDATGCVVAAVGRHVLRLHVVHRLFDVGGLLERELRVRPVPVADVLAAAVRAVGALSWFGGPAHPDVVAVVPPVLGRGPDSLGPGGLPAHLLLLSRRLLQGVLGGPVRLRGRRAAQEVPRRALVSARHPEHPPLLPVRRARSSSSSSRSTRGRRCGSRSAPTR